ncbi:Serine/threonine-protein kinase PrkC [Luteitalea pratensis]|uniref:Serine/threonine-protein kinase PrkC n=1 Tax=Luteitalea pratensis TaxID=1855912 RepID=A0A143PL51_LUTPR|nr:Serine/threonine-protein kinase PrkC [Luteitalea pratensis]
MSLNAGARIGPYEIVARLGAGGMGEVYRARDARLDRSVAIKVLTSARAIDHAQLDRFQREARAIARVSHPHFCTLYDVGQQDGVPFLVMELLEGDTLAERLTMATVPVVRPSASPSRLPRRWMRPTARASSIATSSQATSC